MTHVLQQTLDGSHTIYIPEMDEHYHSTNGAIQEAQHIYISKAYNFSNCTNPTVFEVGFGTGLNALLTALEAEKQQRKTTYISIEKYPIAEAEYSLLNFPYLIEENPIELFSKIQSASWNEFVEISPWFSLKKIHADLVNLGLIVIVGILDVDTCTANHNIIQYILTQLA